MAFPCAQNPCLRDRFSLSLKNFAFCFCNFFWCVALCKNQCKSVQGSRVGVQWMFLLRQEQQRYFAQNISTSVCQPYFFRLDDLMSSESRLKCFSQATQMQWVPWIVWVSWRSATSGEPWKKPGVPHFQLNPGWLLYRDPYIGLL